MAMKLISLQAALSSINFETGVIDSVATSALNTATSDLESLTRQTFAQETKTDLYYIPKGRQLNFTGAGNPNNHIFPIFAGTSQLKLALRKGLVTAPPTIIFASSVSDLTENPTVAVWNTDFVYDAEMGVVTMLDLVLDDSYVQISYTGGYPSDPSDGQLYLQSAVPDWLVQAAKAQFVLSLDSYAPNARTNSKTPVNTKVVYDGLMRRLDGHVRYFPMATFPI